MAYVSKFLTRINEIKELLGKEEFYQLSFDEKISIYCELDNQLFFARFERQDISALHNNFFESLSSDKNPRLRKDMMDLICYERNSLHEMRLEAFQKITWSQEELKHLLKNTTNYMKKRIIESYPNNEELKSVYLEGASKAMRIHLENINQRQDYYDTLENF